MTYDTSYILSDFANMSKDGRISMSRFATHCQNTYQIDYSEFLDIIKQHYEIISERNHKYLARKAGAPPITTDTTTLAATTDTATTLPTTTNTTTTTTTIELPLNDILENPIFQPRGSITCKDGIDTDVVEQYAEWLEFSDPPALEVWRGCIDGEDGYWLLSGYHRIRALRNRDRQSFPCVVFSEDSCSFEEAIYRANTSNLKNKERQIFKMRSEECKRACKRFISVMDKLSPQAVQEFIDIAQSITRNTKTWKNLNHSAIGAVFGFSRTSVSNFVKQIDFETALHQIGIVDVENVIYVVPRYRVQFQDGQFMRRGTVKEISVTRSELVVTWDKKKLLYPAKISTETNPPLDALALTDIPREPEPELRDGLNVWVAGHGTGVLIKDERAKMTPDIWSHYPTLPNLSPTQTSRWVDWLVMFDDGMHRWLASFTEGMVDLENDVSPAPTIEERIALLETIQVKDYLAKEQILYLKRQLRSLSSETTADLPNDTAEPLSDLEEESDHQTTAFPEVNPEPESVDDARKRLLGFDTPQGENGAEFPDIPRNDAPNEEDNFPTKEEVMRRELQNALLLIESNISLVPIGDLIRLQATLLNEIDSKTRHSK